MRFGHRAGALAAAEADVAKYATGVPVEVRYDPDKPQTSTLEGGEGGMSVGGIILAIILAAHIAATAGSVTVPTRHEKMSAAAPMRNSHAQASADSARRNSPAAQASRGNELRYDAVFCTSDAPRHENRSFGETAPRHLVRDQIFRSSWGAPEHDFSFLVFGSIGAPNLWGLILLKAKSTLERHRFELHGGGHGP